MTIKNDILDEAIEVLTIYGKHVGRDSLFPMRSFSNHVWKVSTGEEDLVLRRYDHQSFSEVCNTNLNLSCMRNSGLYIPHIVPNINEDLATLHNEHAYDVSEYIQHRPFTYKEMNIESRQIKKTAKTLSQIHQYDFHSLPFPVKNKFEEEVNPEYTLNLVENFVLSYNMLQRDANNRDRKKLNNLAELIHLTSNRRNQIVDSSKDILIGLPNSLTHGDFSLSNLLPESENRIAIIDWENIGIRPRIWELHRSLLLICGRGLCNANFDEINFERATIFINSYKESIEIDKKEWECIPYVAEYIAFVHWIKFTLESVLRRDFRILDRIPDQVEMGLWWLKNSNVYREWINSRIV